MSMFWQTRTSYQFGPFLVDARERRLLRDGQVVPLTPKVFDVLLVLVQNSGRLLTKAEVMKLVWPETVVEEGNIARNISTLRSALGENPRGHQFIETIPWRGYRFVASVKQIRDEMLAPPINSLAVLPFVNVANDPDFEYFTDGITDALINKLAQLTGVRVMSRNSTFRYKGREIDASIIGRELNVQAIITGRIDRHDDLFSISVALVDARDDTHIWGAQYLRTHLEPFTIPEQIAQNVAGQLPRGLSAAEEQRLIKTPTENSEAYKHFLKGRYYFHKLTVDGIEKGVAHFKQAIEKDPSFALAYVGLGDCHNYWAKPNEARQAMSKALELDATLGEAHASLGFFKFIYDWDFAGAEAEFRQALQLNPNYAEAHHWSAIYSANIGRHDQAAAAAGLAVELDPLSLLMNMTPGLVAYLARAYDRAIEHLQKVIEMEPNFPAAHSVLGNTYLHRGLLHEAMAEYQKVLDLSRGVAVVEAAMKPIIAHAYAKLGRRSEAHKLLDELTQTAAESGLSEQNINLSPHSIAEVYAALGDTDQAFAWLEKAFDQHEMQMVSLRVNPTLDPVRVDPRFDDLVRRVGLPS
jgi:DNA-binding winged helix-turn-helix (wHTH) protein/tetratricopeptide (TPR) repeat protein